MSHRLGLCRALFAMLWLAPSLTAAAEPGQQRDRPSDTKLGVEPRPMSTHVYANGGVGWGSVDLDTFVASESGAHFTADLIPTHASGPAADLGVGLRLWGLTIGLRGDVIALRDEEVRRSVGALQLWSIDAELGLRIPFGAVEAHLGLAAGYSTFGGLGDALAGVDRGMDIDGANLRGVLGVDYFFSDRVSLGARGAATALFLSRRSVPVRELARLEEVGTISEAKARALEADGTTVGTSYQVVVGPGIHF